MRSAPGGAPASRRRLLVAAAGGVLLSASSSASGCGSRGRPRMPGLSQHVRTIDAAILNHALTLEHQAIAAYTAGIPLLRGRAQIAARRFLNQELTHAGELAGLIKQAGGRIQKPSPSYQLGHPRSVSDVLRLLHDAEQAQLSWYLENLSSLTPGPLRAPVASVLSNDAQHLAVLRAMLGLEALPGPFVTGSQ